MEPTPIRQADDNNSAFRQWQFEEAINALRRRADEELIKQHWSTTGDTTIDATARAHIAEWLTFDVDRIEPREHESVFEAVTRRAVADQHWELYAVERRGDQRAAVRRLRDDRGFRLRWVEGRDLPPAGFVVALRTGHLNPPGFNVATLPLVFGDRRAGGEVIRALIRAFGDRPPEKWRRFMRGTGARIIVEHALERLYQRAMASPPRRRAA